MTNKEYEIMLQNMTDDQKEAFEAVMSGANVFVSGGGGVGKSFVLRLIVYALELAGKNVMVCAPTGVAASNIEGVTIHAPAGSYAEQYAKENNIPFVAE